MQECKPLYLEYAKLEETYGLARHAMDIYARALAAVPKAERKSVLDLYVSRASDFFGIAKVRRGRDGNPAACGPKALAACEAGEPSTEG